MAKASKTEIFDCSPAEMFAIVSDYEHYPDFLSEMKGCKVLEVDGNRKLVEYSVSVVKSFTYRLWMVEDRENMKITWSFDSGDMFRRSNGSWEFEDAGDGQCKATYAVDAKVKMFVPGPITKMLVNVNLPNMMNAYKERIKTLA